MKHLLLLFRPLPGRLAPLLLQPADQLLREVRVRRLRRKREQLPRQAGLRGHLQEAKQDRGEEDTRERIGFIILMTRMELAVMV